MVAHPEKIERLLDAKEVRAILRCSLPLVYKLAERKQLPCVRFPCPGYGRRARTMLRFKLNDVQAFIDRHYVTA